MNEGVAQNKHTQRKKKEEIMSDEYKVFFILS